MSQHDMQIANNTGIAVRGDINAALAALVTNNSGDTAPSPTYPFMWWADSNTGHLKQRNAANTAWIDNGLMAESILRSGAAYPVGSLYLSATDDDPVTTLGFGTWSAFAAGRALIGAGTYTDSNREERTFAAGDNAGEYSHILTAAEMPAHTHDYVGYGAGGYGSGANSPLTTGKKRGTTSTGGNEAHNNIQPSISIYIWRRTA